MIYLVLYIVVKIVLYADDTALFFASRNIQIIQSALEEDLNAAGEWFSFLVFKIARIG